MATPPRSTDRQRACDRLLVGLVAAIVVVDVLRGAFYVGVLEGGGWTVISAMVDWLPLLAVAALVVGVVAAALRSPRHVGGAVLAAPVVAAYVLTGLVLPWDQTSYRVARSALDAVLSVPVVGGPLADLLFGGPTLSPETLWRAFLLHYALVALGGVVVAVVLRSGGR